MQPKKCLYEQDFYAWGKVQLSLLESQKFTSLDLPNLIQEFESVVRREKNELKSKLALLIMHLLKWKYQPEFRSKSWENTISFCRDDLQELLKDSPSLENEIDNCWEDSYKRSKKEAKKETGLLREFPEKCPFNRKEALDENWMPEE